MKALVTWSAVVLAAVTGVMAQAPLEPVLRPVTGQVVDATNGAPLRRARVVVSSGASVLNAVLTNDEGRFGVETTLAPPLTVRVSKATFAPSVGVAPVSGALEMRVALARSAAIDGRVLDQHGAPVTAAFITARPVATGARPSGQPAARFYTQSDELGEYRLGGLPAGRYEVAAVWVPREQRQGSSDTIEGVLLGATRVEIANGPSTLTLAPGDELANVVFTFAAVPPSCPPAPGSPLIKGTATIAGRVSGPFGEPLCAVVRIVAPAAERQQVVTDDEGRYALTNLGAGSFVVEAEPVRTTYTTLLHGQRRPSDPEVPVTRRAGERRDGTDFVLPRKGIVSGTVLDEHGEPMEAISVQAFRLSSVEGRSIGTVVGQSRPIDDRGRYRITGLGTGEYVVRAIVRGEMPVSAAGQAEGYASVFYPGTPDVAAARRVPLDVDAHLRDTDIVVAPTPLTTVSGVVVDERGRPVAAAVTITVSARSGAPVLEQWSASSNSEGTFAIRNVPSGEYVVKAVRTGPGAQPFGMRYAKITDERAVDLSIVVAPQATVEGRVIVEGVPDPDEMGIVVGIHTANDDYSSETHSGLPTSFTPSGSGLQGGLFHVGYVTGPSRLQVRTPECESCYLKSAVVNGVDATDRPFDFGLKGGAYRDAEVVVSPAGAAVEGRVGDTRAAVAAPVAIVVFPTNRELWCARSRHVKVGRSATDGSFRVAGLPPGEYLVAAVGTSDSTSRAGLAGADALDELSTLAARVTLAEGQRQFVALRPVRR